MGHWLEGLRIENFGFGVVGLRAVWVLKFGLGLAFKALALVPLVKVDWI